MINCDLSILIFTRYFNVILMRNRKNLEKHYIFKTIWLNIIIIHRHWKTNSSGNARALDFFKSDYMFTFLLRSFSMCIFYINVHHFFLLVEIPLYHSRGVGYSLVIAISLLSFCRVLFQRKLYIYHYIFYVYTIYLPHLRRQ